jgi:copper chaperone
MSAIVKQEFTVGGMSCGGCAGSVTRAVSQLPGVRKVDVSLTDKAATVEYDGAAVDAAAIVRAIEDAGFEAAAR